MKTQRSEQGRIFYTHTLKRCSGDRHIVFDLVNTRYR